MMCYYLLRKNKESGPLTLTELKAMSLLKTDLVWVNGESTCWRSPDEVEELKGLAKDPQNEPKDHKKKERQTAPALTYTATTAASYQQNHYTDSAEPEQSSDEPLPKPSFEELKKKYAAKTPRKKVWKSQINIGANLMGVATLVIGVSVAAFMMKKAVDNIEHEPIVATAEAVEIGAVETHISTSSQAAMAPGAAIIAATLNTSPVPDETAVLSTTASVSIKEPVKKEAVVSSPSSPVTEKSQLEKEAHQQPILPKEKPAVDENNAEIEDHAGLSSAEKKDENKDADEKNEKKRNKSNLQLFANDYKVGFLGGISNLSFPFQTLLRKPSAKPLWKWSI